MNVFIVILSLLSSLTTSSPLTPRQATNEPHPPTILWSCLGNTNQALNIPSACANMCYGAYCRGYGSTLTWNTNYGAPEIWIELFRKHNAGCYVGVEGDNDTGIVGWQDRCQRQGTACSVYPYVTASNGDVDVQKGGPVSRCVDTGEYYRQAAVLFLLYTSGGPWSDGQGLNSTSQPATFHQIFANAGEVPYCSGLSSDCITDGAEFDRDGVIFTYDPPSKKQTGQQEQRKRQRRYRLSGGANFTVTEEMEVGRQVLLPRVRDGKAFVEVSERGGVERERMLEQLGQLLYFDVDEVVEEVFGESV